MHSTEKSNDYVNTLFVHALKREPGFAISPLSKPIVNLIFKYKQIEEINLGLVCAQLKNLLQLESADFILDHINGLDENNPENLRLKETVTNLKNWVKGSPEESLRYYVSRIIPLVKYLSAAELVDFHGWTALNWVIYANHTELFMLMLEDAQAWINEHPEEREELLWQAVSSSNTEILSALIEICDLSRTQIIKIIEPAIEQLSSSAAKERVGGFLREFETAAKKFSFFR